MILRARISCLFHLWWIGLDDDTFYLALVCGKCGW